MNKVRGTPHIKRFLAVLLVASSGVAGVQASDVTPREKRIIRMAQYQGGTTGSAAKAAQETIVIEGKVVEGGVECALFRTDDGREFTLAGFRPHLLPVGTQMRLRGHIMTISPCRQGISFKTAERLE